MHPILFRIPLPGGKLPVAWAVVAIAAIAFLWGIYLLVKKDRSGALVRFGAGAIALVVRFAVLKPEQASVEMANLPIYSYGVMLGLSLVVGWYITLGLAERDGLPKESMANCYVFTAVAAVLGSRILYILTNLHEFDTFASLFAMRRGGLVAYGGFLGGYVGSWLFLNYELTDKNSIRRRAYPISILPWADVAVPSLATGLLITRIGCYLFGCDFGQPLSATAPEWLKKLGSFPHWPLGTLDGSEGSPAWAQHVKERGLSHEALTSLPVHPTQIYESLVGLSLFVLLLLVRRNQRFRGQIFLTFTFAYGVCRYALEILRDDDQRGSLPPSLPQHLLIPLGFLIFAVAWAIGFSKSLEKPGEKPKTVLGIPLDFRGLTMVLAFVPAIATYILMKPESYGLAPSIEFSTSQIVALTTGFAAAVGYSILHRAAVAHPQAAMALNLPPVGDAQQPAIAEEEDDDEDDEEEDEAPKKKAPEKAAKPVEKAPAKKTAVKSKAAEPKKAEPKKIAKKAEEKPAKDDGDDDDDDGSDDDA
jgi:phosphatidylglycerol:prolipoprotein diacylglycerol transferase